MKIQTQTRILIFSIVAVPLFVILTQVVYRQFISEDVIFGLPAYDDVSAMLEEHISPEYWDSISRNIVRFRQFGDVVILRNDFFVIYSEIPYFSPNVYITWENIAPFMEDQRFIFSSIGKEKKYGYILVEIKSQAIKDSFFPFFVHALIGIIVIGILIIVAICMSIVIARTINNSIKVLENTTRRIAEGELDLKVDVKGSNEIISLTKSLNKMRDALKEDELRRSRFIMGVTHDLKTPLALIKGYAEAIEDGVIEAPESRANAAEIIIEKTDQLEDMINDLISYVRLETGELRTQLDNVNLTAFLQKLANTLSNDVELLHHTFISEINLPHKTSVPMDEKLIIRAFENLVHNAVRYTPDGSVIRLTAVPLKYGAEITVSDNGPGLDKGDLPHIFEMFYRGSSSRREQGLGLGLAVVKWVMDYHGWLITVSSEQGGTKFTITVPLT
ncbi:MAG: HAMP domain-containing histidine kinase [Treponema sp.]|nr:HAMP domain-containing histidine kinase [Treponema sp.]